MFYRKKVPSLISDKFVKVNEAVKEDADLGTVFTKLGECEVTLSWRWLNHIVHLTK